AVGHSAWARRAGRHPRVVAALAAGQVPEPAGRLICLWTGKLPEQYRDDADEVLVAAAAAGLGLEELAGLFGQMDERARGDRPPECAEMVGRVLDALSAPAGAEDTRTREQRYHDALAEAMRQLGFCIV